MDSQTPMMRQYWKIKEKYPDAILFFRMGDFYEMFHHDAEIASRVLGLTLTSRSKGEANPVPLAGVPWHKADVYIDRLLGKGYKVAVCDQTEDPKKAKGLVRREVTDVVTPGTALTDRSLHDKRPNYLVALSPGMSNRERVIGLAAIDVSTGDFRLGEFAPEEVGEEIARFDPAEVLLPEEERERLGPFDRGTREPTITGMHGWRFDGEEGERILEEHFAVETLDGFGCTNHRHGLAAAGVLIQYLRELGKSDLGHVDRVRLISTDECLVLDETTRRNLEIFRPLREGREGTTLLSIIDSTQTAMGGRLLREWLLRPLRDAAAIGRRLDVVEEAARRAPWREETREVLTRFGDLERLAGKIVLGRGNPRDLVALKSTLRLVPELGEVVARGESPLCKEIALRLTPLDDVADRIEETLVDEPPPLLKEGGVIRDGFHAELDELRYVGAHGQNWIASFQGEERKRTGISTLKVAFNKVFGYYIEVGKSKASEVPPTYTRKQTLVNAERFITPELKEQEEKILGAEEKSRALEEELFLLLRKEVAGRGPEIRRLGEAVAELDVLLAFADTAVRRKYCRPTVGMGNQILIEKGRHPVVEAILGPGEFIPNDTLLDADENQIHILTGPNMAGKSTYLRQVALIQILSQAGSFVPAEKADLGVVDRIFTRVGAADDLARGQSTFLVEMTETANILHNATGRSLVLLDEIGRGTSTFDGVSIAWAVVEYLHRHRERGAKTLFATHYHELAVLAEQLERVHNYCVQVKEWKDRIVFLRRIAPGSVDRSYGIQVARLAGLPQEVIDRAKEVLHHLEEEHASTPERIRPADAVPFQISLFQRDEEKIVEELRTIDPERITPIESLRLLKEWRDRIEGKGEKDG